MEETEKVSFLKKKVRQLMTIIDEIENEFPEKSFKLDGILVGNIGEVLAAHYYGIKLYSQSNPTYDGETIDTKRKVQIKVTQNTNIVIIRERPDYLIVLHLDSKRGEVSEIYNGPGALPFKSAKYVPSQNNYQMRVSKLLELNTTVEETGRIPAVVPIEKFDKNKVKGVCLNISKSSEKPSLIPGYENRHSQRNLGYAGHMGNRPEQRAFRMKCLNCEYEYESNGCDVWQHKCPRCQGGKE